MLNIIRKNGIRYELHNDRINELKNDNIQLGAKIIGKRYFFSNCAEVPPRKKIKQDDSAIERTNIDQMSIREILESSKCVICHDIYEQTILDRGCKQAICIPCYEKVIKNECPVCRDEFDLIKLAPKSAKAITKAIDKCGQMREWDEHETREAAKKHMDFYRNNYYLRAPETFDSQYDLTDYPPISNTSVNAESDSSDSDVSYTNARTSYSRSNISALSELPEARDFFPDSESNSSDDGNNCSNRQTAGSQSNILNVKTPSSDSESSSSDDDNNCSNRQTAGSQSNILNVKTPSSDSESSSSDDDNNCSNRQTAGSQSNILNVKTPSSDSESNSSDDGNNCSNRQTAGSQGNVLNVKTPSSDSESNLSDDNCPYYQTAGS